MTNMRKPMLFALLVLSAGISFAATVRTVASGFNGSGDLLVDANGDIFVANYGLRANNADGTTIVKISSDGQVSQFASGFQGASGMAMDQSGNIIQASIIGNTLSRVTPSGTVSTIVSQGLNQPVGVAVNSNGQIFVANCGNNTISRVDNGVAVTFSNNPLFQCPNGLTVDSDDNLYAVNYNNGAVFKIDSQGNASLLGDSGGGNGHIVFGNDKLYFANHFLGQVFEMSLDGSLSVLAGTGVLGHDDGDAMEATFSGLNGIGISPDGKTIYVNEPIAIGLPFGIILNPNTLRAIDLSNTIENEFTINSGLAGSWYDPNQDGQGMVFDFAISSDRFNLVMYWFTFDNLPPSSSTEINGFGSKQNRWFTGLGPVNGHTVEMPIFRTSGGVFFDSTPVETTAVGTARIEFFNCFEAMLSFEFDEPETISGDIPIQRLTPDINCESLAEGN